MANTKCTIWEKEVMNSGYGRITTGGKRYLAHRYFYELKYGKIPKGLVIDHLCRNPICVNPEHLEAVTQKTNIHRGQTSKLTEAVIAKIRKLYKSKKFKQYELGRLFGVGQDEISRIVNHKRWA